MIDVIPVYTHKLQVWFFQYLLYGYVKSRNRAVLSLLWCNQADNQYQLGRHNYPTSYIVYSAAAAAFLFLELLVTLNPARDSQFITVFIRDHLLNNNEGVVKMSENIIFKINDVLSHTQLWFSFPLNFSKTWDNK